MILPSASSPKYTVGVPVRLSAGSAVSATRTSLLMGLPSSFTARGSAAVAPCCRMAMASCWVWPSKLTKSGTVVTLAASAESVASSEAMAATSCSEESACCTALEEASLYS